MSHANTADEGPEQFAPLKLIEALGASSPDLGAAVADLLGVCYWASLHSEEGRWTSCTVVFVPPGGVPAGALALAKPLPLTADSLRRIAPACATDHSGIWVTPGNGGRLSIRGFASPDAARTPLWSDIKVRIVGPAQLTLVFGSSRAAYRAGTYLAHESHELLRQAIDQLPTDGLLLVENALLSGGDEAALAVGTGSVQLSAEETTAARRSLAGWAARLRAHALLQLSEQMVRLGHGGAALVCPDPGDALNEILNAGREPHWLATEARLHWPNWIDHSAQYLAAAEAVADKASEERLRQRAVPGLNGLRSAVIATAALTQVDGAVLLMADGSPRLFGTFFDTRVHAPTSIEEHLEASRRGGRHYSTVRAVAALPDTLGIIASSDGELSIVSSLGDETTYHQTFV